MKKEKKKEEKVYGFINFFYDTEYTSNTVNGITKIYDDLKWRFPCNRCQLNCVDTKITVQDTHNPTFVILRQKYCHKCWLRIMNDK